MELLQSCAKPLVCVWKKQELPGVWDLPVIKALDWHHWIMLCIVQSSDTVLCHSLSNHKHPGVLAIIPGHEAPSFTHHYGRVVWLLSWASLVAPDPDCRCDTCGRCGRVPVVVFSVRIWGRVYGAPALCCSYCPCYRGSWAAWHALCAWRVYGLKRKECTVKSNIRRTKSQHLKDSRTVLRLSLPNPLKPDVKSRTKI